ETTGASFHDTATVSGVAPITPTGTVTYSFFLNVLCTAPASTTQTVTLADEIGRASCRERALGSGADSFEDNYSGDRSDTGSTSPCEPFVVFKAASSTSALVISDATGVAPSGSETTGASFHDTATVAGVGGFTPTGTVTYSFFLNGACTAPASTTQMVTLAD